MSAQKSTPANQLPPTLSYNPPTPPQPSSYNPPSPFNPPMAASKSNASFPVVVFIHGESYDTGSASAYDATVMASFGDVIVATLNYRLGALGELLLLVLLLIILLLLLKLLLPMLMLFVFLLMLLLSILMFLCELSIIIYLCLFIHLNLKKNSQTA